MTKDKKNSKPAKPEEGLYNLWTSGFEFQFPTYEMSVNPEKKSDTDVNAGKKPAIDVIPELPPQNGKDEEKLKAPKKSQKKKIRNRERVLIASMGSVVGRLPFTDFVEEESEEETTADNVEDESEESTLLSETTAELEEKGTSESTAGSMECLSGESTLILDTTAELEEREDMLKDMIEFYTCLNQYRTETEEEKRMQRIKYYKLLSETTAETEEEKYNNKVKCYNRVYGPSFPALLIETNSLKEACRIMSIERAKLAKIKEQEDADLAKIKEQEDADLAKIKEQEDADLAKIKEQDDAYLAKIKEEEKKSWAPVEKKKITLEVPPNGWSNATTKKKGPKPPKVKISNKNRKLVVKMGSA